MPRKKTRVPKEGPVWHRSAEEATLDQMPKFNAHACRTGAHGDAKYNRAKQKRSWQREMEREGARNRGRLPLIGALSRGAAMKDRNNAPFQSYWGFTPIAVPDSANHALNQAMFHRRGNADPNRMRMCATYGSLYRALGRFCLGKMTKCKDC